MQVSILGPVEVTDDDGRVRPVAGGRVRTLLARLALDAGRAVPGHGLVDELWADEPPADPGNALQSLVSRLRRALGDPALVAPDGGGYRLAVGPDDVDVSRLRRLLAGSPPPAATDSAARALLGDTLRSIRGDAVPELSVAHAVAIEELVLDAWELWLSAELAARPDLAAGGSTDVAEVVRRADELVRRHPLRERFTAALMQALDRSGRTAEALAAYERTRNRLVDELGTDPGPELQQLHLALLQREPVAPIAPRTARRTNLRAAMTSFLGRDAERQRVGTLLREGRLVTIVGPGGAGKTRLAGVAGADQVDHTPGGVWMIELAQVTVPGALPQVFLGALGQQVSEVVERNQERPVVDPTSRLVDVLADTETLLIVDNCEHLIGAVADLLDELLASCPGLQVLATSREPLGIAGESLCLLAPLELPRPDAMAESALRQPSVQLFADRARSVDPDFVVDETTVRDVVEVVRRLDGLPLAIELAAARLRVLPLRDVADRLSDRFRLLTGGSRTALPRHRTLRAVVEWSWDLLSEPEQRLAETLAVFPAGAGVEAARAVGVTVGLEPDGVVDLLDALVDKSLLRVEGRGPTLRYRMLETIREFGVERLAAAGIIRAVHEAHSVHYAAFAHDAAKHFRRADQLDWLARFNADRGNIFAALDFAIDNGVAMRSLVLANDLAGYWTLTGSHDDAAQWLVRALAVPGEVDPAQQLVAEGLLAMNRLATRYDHSELVADPEHPTAPSAGVDDEITRVAGAIDALGLDGSDQELVLLRPMLSFFTTDRDELRTAMTASLAVADEWTRGALLMFRGNMAENDGDLDAMRGDTAEALEIFTRLGERWGLASCLAASAQLATVDGDTDRAIAEYERAVQYLTEFGAGADLTFMRARLAQLWLRRGDATRARSHWATLRDEAVSRSDRLMADTCLGTILRYEQAGRAELMAIRDRLREHIEAIGVVHPLAGHMRAMACGLVSALDVDLGDLDEAAVMARDAYVTAVATRDVPILAAIGTVMAYWAEVNDGPRRAATVLGASAALLGRLDLAPDTVTLIDRLRAVLGEDGYAEAFAAGRHCSRDDAVQLLEPRTLAPTPA